MGTAPEPDADSAAWWDGLRAHRVVLQRCDACGRARFPPMPSCPWCGGRGASALDASGRGTVYSYVTAHQAVSPGYAGELPYTIATVELDEGPRVLGRVEPPLAASVGAEVQAVFVDHPEWTELRFGVAP
ncbi:MAG TPA: OB-fold domain-containing protein [Acidimicrobiales bacterium]|nr:OB-fold domain-containing protein [Acidimicrobiales bacterium]